MDQRNQHRFVSMAVMARYRDASVLLGVSVSLLDIHSKPSPFPECLDRCAATIHDFELRVSSSKCQGDLCVAPQALSLKVCGVLLLEYLSVDILPPVIIHFLFHSKDRGQNYPHDQANHP